MDKVIKSTLDKEEILPEQAQIWEAIGKTMYPCNHALITLWLQCSGIGEGMGAQSTVEKSGQHLRSSMLKNLVVEII